MFDYSSTSFCLFLFIAVLSIQSTFSLVCFECGNCNSTQACQCDNEVIINTESSYCILLRERYPNDVLNIEIKHIPRNLTVYYISDPYFITVEEVIFYDETSEKWLSESNKITYGCQTDKCNRDYLLKDLPANGLSLMLPTDWLNEQFQRKPNQNVTECFDCTSESPCSDTPDFINTDGCERRQCLGSCIIGEQPVKFDTTTQFCYDSFCSDDSSYGPEVQRPNISITAIYYLRTQRFDVVQIDAFCNGYNCTGLEIFKDMRSKVQKNLDGIKPFLPSNFGNTIYSISSTALIMLLLQMLNFY